MARRRTTEEHENHERWLVSYADFITLLFAFFVVMYSVSSVNEGKFRVLADSLVANFPDRMKSLSPIQIGELVRSPYHEQQQSIRATPLIPEHIRGAYKTEGGELGEAQGEPDDAKDASDDTADGDDVVTADPTSQAEIEIESAAEEVRGHESASETVAGEGQDGEAMSDIETVAVEVKQSMAPLIDDDLMEVREGEAWLEIEFKSNILFSSGNAKLGRRAMPILTELAEILKTFPNPIQVEGFTDNIPIRTSVFPSNWELSAGRAASVVHLFNELGVHPDRMVAIGYGEYRPVADNSTADGRNRNRRVVVVIPADGETRRIMDLHRQTTGDTRQDGGG